MDENRKKALISLQTSTHPLCVMSTVTVDNVSESSLLAYVVREDLSLRISTHTSTRKWKNLESNTAVSLVFGLAFGVVNVQYEGVARLITEPVEIKKYDEEYFSARPELKQYRVNDTGFIEITPRWVRTVDFTQTPPRVEESSF